MGDLCPYCVTALPLDKAGRPTGRRYDDGLRRDKVYHPDCFREWRINCERFYAELDRPMNSCVYFVRTGSSMHGSYVREGERHPCLAVWVEADVFGTNLFPRALPAMDVDPWTTLAVVDPVGILAAFRAFLGKHGWLGEGWYAARKEPVYTDAVLVQRRTATKGS